MKSKPNMGHRLGLWAGAVSRILNRATSGPADDDIRAVTQEFRLGANGCLESIGGREKNVGDNVGDDEVESARATCKPP